MNPSVELDALYVQASYTAGVTPPPNASYTFPPLGAIFPRVDCRDLATLDWALRATLRVKTWTCTLSYDSYVATTISTADGEEVKVTYAAGPSGTQEQDYAAAAGEASDGTRYTRLDEVRLLSCFLGEYGAASSTAPAPIRGGVVCLQANNTTMPGYCLTVVLIDAVPVTAQGLRYVFTLDAQLTFLGLPVNDGYGTTGQVIVQITGTAMPTAASLQAVSPLSFDGQNFNALTPANAQPKDFDPGYDPGSNPKTTMETIYRATRVDVVAKQYWTYDGKFDPDSGAVVSAGDP